jgi:hypothetical protein
MPEEKKKKTTTPKRPRAPRKKTVKTTVKVSRSKKISPTPTENILDLSRVITPSIKEEIIFPTLEPEPEPVVMPVQPRTRSSRMYSRISLSFVLLSVFFLAIVVYVTYVRLDIVITPQVRQVEAKTNFTVYDRPDNYEVPAGSILGMVRGMEVEYTQTTPASEKTVSGAEVSGSVLIINNYSKAQPLVATTRLLTPDNQLLRLTETVVVPAGGSVEASVYAETADPSFTLTNTRLTIPGLWAGLQDQIYAEAKVGSVTYKEKAEYSITQNDIDQAIARGKTGLIEKARIEIDSVYASYDQKLYELDEPSLKIEIDGKVGEIKNEVEATISGTVKVIAFNQESISETLGTALSSVGSLDNGTDSLIQPRFTVLSADIKNNLAEIEVVTSGSSVATSGQKIINPKKIVGLKRNQLEAYLQSIPEIESAELRFRPSFWQWSPYLEDRIFVTIK